MRSLITIAFFLIHTLSGFPQTKTIKYYDNGKVKLEGFIKNNSYDSIFISYYENGNKKTEGTYKKVGYHTSSTSIIQSACGTGRDTTEPSEGIKNGKWKHFYENGQLQNVSNYFGNIQVGQSLSYDSTGKLTMNEFYNAGNLIQRQEYFNNGNLKSLFTRTFESFIEDKKYKAVYKTVYVDKVLEYYETGELRCIKFFNNDDELNGKYIEYWQNGFVKIEGEYKDGNKNGIFREYYENGNTKFEGIIKDDIPQGKQYFSNEKGKSIKIETWKNGKIIKTEEKSGS
jgi:antitoxin component YwqK of YwqJK toxin-antitoxin module